LKEVIFGNFLSWNPQTFWDIKLWFLLLNTKPELQWQILDENTSQKFPFSVLNLDLKFAKM
jgi:hypothetical protein